MHCFASKTVNYTVISEGHFQKFLHNKSHMITFYINNLVSVMYRLFQYNIFYPGGLCVTLCTVLTTCIGYQ